jgi:hypothetical protein
MTVLAAVGLEELLAGAGIAGNGGGAVGTESANEGDDLPDFAAVHGETGHGCSGDALSDDAEETFVIRGVAEISSGEVGAAGAALTVNTVATGALGAVEGVTAGTVIGGLEGVFEGAVAMLGGKGRGAQ